MLPGGSELGVDLEFERFEFEGEPAVRVRVPTQKRDLASLTSQLEEALRFDTSTGLLKRAAFLDQGAAQASHLLKAGIRAVAYLEPDRLATLESELGPVAVEDVMDELGRPAAQPAAARRHRRPRVGARVRRPRRARQRA